MLDIRWLEDLVALAETRSYTRAAEIRNVTQSGFSRRIQSLEHWAGAPLVDRRRTPLDLTPAGQRLLAAVGPALCSIQDARREIREQAETEARIIRIAAPHILSVTFFPRWLPLVQRIVGQVRLAILSDNLPGCCAAVEDASADMLVCLVDQAGSVVRGAGRADDFARWQSLAVGRERLIPLAAPDAEGSPLHSFRGHRPVSYLGYSPECSLGWAVEGVLAGRTGLPERQQLYENSLADGLRAMALSGMGVAWLPLTACHGDLLRGRLVRAGDPSLDVPLDIRLFRPERRISRKAEEMWLRLSLDAAALDCPDVPAVAALG